MLRESREALGLRVADVARDLRIRKPYIEAIEDDRYGDLPGSAYAPAFLRAYAGHLGLDPERVLAAYRDTASRPPVASGALAFPVAPLERRTPKGALVFASLVLLVGAYLTWQHFSRGDGPTVERVARPPERLLTGTPPETVVAPAAPAFATSPAAVGRTTPPTAASAAPAPAPERPGQPAAVAPTPAPAAASPALPPASPPVEVIRPGVTAAAPTAPAPAATIVQPPTPAPQQAAAPSLPAPVTVATPAGAAHAAQLPPPPRHGGEEPAGRAEPQNQAQSAPPTAQDRTIVPRVASVLELRDPAGEVLAVTHVPAGQPYTVPAGIGYRLLPAVRP